MSVLWTGLVHVFGPPSSGKTSFALTASDKPEMVYFLDGDTSKGREMAADIGVKHYFDLAEMGRDKNEIQYHEMVLDLIEKAPDNLDVMILDNPTEFFKGGHSYVSENRKHFRARWSASGKWAAMQEYGVLRNTHLPHVFSTMLSKAKLVMVLTHQSDEYDNDTGVKTGRKVADADESLEKSASVIIRLARDTRSQGFAPVGLLIKKYRPQFIVDERRIVDVYPDRIAPCTWDKIEYYLENPVGLKDELDENEQPDDFELSLIEGSLTPEQQRVFELNKKLALINSNRELSDAVIELASNNVPPPMMVKHLKDDYGIEADFGTVQSILSAAKGIG